MRKFNCFICLAFSLIMLAACNGGAGRYLVVSGYAQGGRYTVKYCNRGVSEKPEVVAATIDSLLREIDFTLSGYNKGSILSRLNSGQRVKPNHILEDIYAMSREYYERYDGAFDVASGPLFDIWGFGFTHDSLPGPDKVSEAMLRSGMGRLRSTLMEAVGTDGMLEASDLLLEPGGSAPVLNFNAIAQGYTSDLIADYLKSLGVDAMLVDIGEIYCQGLNQASRGWQIGIDSPYDGNDSPGAELKGIWDSHGAACGIVTSGNYRKFYVRDGRKYAHTIDPRTGYPVSHGLLSATIVAPTSAAADALATICMVLGTEEARAMIESDPSLEGCLIYASEDGDMTVWNSPGFSITSSR